VLACALRSWQCQSFEVALEIGAFDVREVAAIKRIDAGLDPRAERFQSETVFSPTLLKYAQGVAYSLACVLVFAGFDNLLNKGVLLGCQADVPSRHLGLATIASAYHQWQSLPIGADPGDANWLTPDGDTSLRSMLRATPSLASVAVSVQIVSGRWVM